MEKDSGFARLGMLQSRGKKRSTQGVTTERMESKSQLGREEERIAGMTQRLMKKKIKEQLRIFFQNKIKKTT